MVKSWYVFYMCWQHRDTYGSVNSLFSFFVVPHWARWSEEQACVGEGPTRLCEGGHVEPVRLLIDIVCRTFLHKHCVCINFWIFLRIERHVDTTPNFTQIITKNYAKFLILTKTCVFVFAKIFVFISNSFVTPVTIAYETLLFVSETCGKLLAELCGKFEKVSLKVRVAPIYSFVVALLLLLWHTFQWTKPTNFRASSINIRTMGGTPHGSFL